MPTLRPLINAVSNCLGFCLALSAPGIEIELPSSVLARSDRADPEVGMEGRRFTQWLRQAPMLTRGRRGRLLEALRAAAVPDRRCAAIEGTDKPERLRGPRLSA